MSTGIPKHNPSGAYDPTAYEAMNKVQKEQSEDEIRVSRLVKAIKTICDLAGYDVLNRIEFRDRETGRYYR